MTDEPERRMLILTREEFDHDWMYPPTVMFDDLPLAPHHTDAEYDALKAKLDEAESSILVWQSKYEEVRADNLLLNSVEVERLRKAIDKSGFRVCENPDGMISLPHKYIGSKRPVPNNDKED